MRRLALLLLALAALAGCAEDGSLRIKFEPLSQDPAERAGAHGGLMVGPEMKLKSD
jgi:hypothetical protein